jgi:prophage antirepressor-like protein
MTTSEKFCINTYFNNLPIRIIGTPDEPYFYLSDIAKILGITNVRNSVKNFNEFELVSREERIRKNITTYKKYNDKFVECNNIILLTELGMYRLILRSNMPSAHKLHFHLYDIIRVARKASDVKLNVIQNELSEIKSKYEKLIMEYKIKATLRTKYKDKYRSKFRLKYDRANHNDIDYENTYVIGYAEDNIVINNDNTDNDKKYYIKIGRTQHDPTVRLKQLQTGNPKALQLLFYGRFPCVVNVESYIHKFYHIKRVSGEWFLLSHDDLMLLHRNLCR